MPPPPPTPPTMDYDASPSLPVAPPLVHGGAMWQQLSIGGSSSATAIMDSGAGANNTYPERPGEPDCAYYLRTGLCRFGTTCKFNHPPDRKLAIAAARLKGEYPERVGQPECQFYLKTGTCKFGPTCKFHHPKDKAGIVGKAQLNSLGYPLRPGEKECAYYLRTLECKFGMTCKFHHPDPSADASSPSVFSVNSNNAPSVNPGQNNNNTYSAAAAGGGGVTSWPVSKAPFIASPRWEQGAASSSYAQLMVPQGLVPLPSWNAYTGQLLPVSSGETSQQNPTGYHLYSTTEASTTSISVPPQYPSALPRESIFPERPEQPECQYYMKTGDCKFGVTCKFHHPSERRVPPPDCLLSPLGLPLRPMETVFESDSENIKKFMELALDQAKCAFDNLEVPIGCVLVEDGKVIATGYNKTTETRNATRHAEMEAIDTLLHQWQKSGLSKSQIAQKFSNCILYVTCEPCIMCAMALSILGIKEVFFGCANDKFGGCGSILSLHKVEADENCSEGGASQSKGFKCTGGYMADEAVSLLRNFYEQGNPNAPKPHRPVRVPQAPLNQQ